MLTNKAVYDFIPSYSGLKKDVVQYFCAHYNIPYDHESMGSKYDAFWSEEFEIRVLPAKSTPLSEDQKLNWELKRKV